LAAHLGGRREASHEDAADRLIQHAVETRYRAGREPSEEEARQAFPDAEAIVEDIRDRIGHQ
jgi:hypothetical protein